MEGLAMTMTGGKKKRATKKVNKPKPKPVKRKPKK
jgi:hypothetical protein